MSRRPIAATPPLSSRPVSLSSFTHNSTFTGLTCPPFLFLTPIIAIFANPREGFPFILILCCISGLPTVPVPSTIWPYSSVNEKPASFLLIFRSVKRERATSNSFSGLHTSCLYSSLIIFAGNLVSSEKRTGISYS